MPYKAKIIKTKMKDTDGLDISFDLLAGNYSKSTIDDVTPDEPEPEPGDEPSDDDGNGG